LNVIKKKTKGRKKEKRKRKNAESKTELDTSLFGLSIKTGLCAQMPALPICPGPIQLILCSYKRAVCTFLSALLENVKATAESETCGGF
jgi:hypothetical protein